MGRLSRARLLLWEAAVVPWHADVNHEKSGVFTLTVNGLVPFAETEPEDTQTPVICSQCGGIQDLILESLGPGIPPRSGLISAEHSCGTCEAFFAPASPMESAAQFLDAAVGAHGILQREDSYLHCGEPMEEGELQISALKVDAGDLFDAPSIRVEMMVLKCKCGFQMSVPTD